MPQRFIDKPIRSGIHQPTMGLLLFAMLLIQTPANPASDKGVITGRLLTIDGMPAVSVRVMAMAVAEPAAGSAVAIVSLTVTDSAGRYRLENIPAGKYYITAGLTDLPTYYPGATAAANASVLTVAQGSITNGIDFSMLRGTGVKVTGRLAVLPTLKPSTPAKATILGIVPPTIETTINEDRTFVFPLVRPGTYTLRTSVGLVPSTFVVVNDRDVDVVVGGDAKGVRVIGKLVEQSASGTQPAIQIISLNANANGQVFSATTNADGSFEFLRLPPGIYNVRSVASFGRISNSTLVVADKDITNFEVTVPYLAVVSGTITVEGGGAPPPQMIWGIEARSFNGTSATAVSTTAVGSIGPFTLRLSEGSHQISIRNLPAGYVTRSITSGDVDLTKSVLDVSPGKPIDEVRIVVGKSPVETINPVPQRSPERR